MSFHRRIHLPGSVYYVVQVGNGQLPLFASTDHYDLYQTLMQRALARTQTKALAYCCLPFGAHLVLQAGDVPIGRFVQGFSACYARSIHRENREIGHLFTHRYRVACRVSSFEDHSISWIGDHLIS